MRALEMLARLMEGQIIYFGTDSFQFDREKNILFSRKEGEVWNKQDVQLVDFIQLSNRGFLTSSPNPLLTSN
jgi:hypothetical protein